MDKNYDEAGFSKYHNERNGNSFYFAHPEIWQPEVDVIIPPGYEKEIGWQSGDVMFRHMPENASLEDLFRNLTKPSVVVELGCGIGRASVWLAKYYQWEKSTFYLLDGTGMDITHGIDDAATGFYNSMEGTRAYVSLNLPDTEVHYVDVGQPWTTEAPELLMSFLAFGYHWDFGPYLRRFEDAMEKDSYAVFGTSGYDRGGSQFGGGVKARRFLERMISEIDTTKWSIVRDARLPEARKASVLVLRRR